MENKTHKTLDRFAFLRSYLSTIEDLPSETEQLAVFKAIAHYGLNGEEPDFSGLNGECYLKAIWRSIKPNIDSSVARQQSPGPSIGSRNNPNGRRGKASDQDQQEPPQEDSQTPSPETPKRKAKTFFPPTVDEVKAYAEERGFKDPDGFAAHFVAYYSEGEHKWHLSNGKPMKDWKKAVITWEPNNKHKTFGPTPWPQAQPSMHERRPDYLDD